MTVSNPRTTSEMQVLSLLNQVTTHNKNPQKIIIELCKHMTQTQIAEHVNVSQDYISKIKLGQRHGLALLDKLICLDILYSKEAA